MEEIDSLSFRGSHYLDFVNKFLKGKDVHDNQDDYDIETKTALYEVKGCKLIENHQIDYEKSGHKCILRGRYYIDVTNHKKMIEAATKSAKKAKYAFCVSFAGRMLWKTMSHQAVSMLLDGKEIKQRKDREGDKYCFLSVKEVW